MFSYLYYERKRCSWLPPWSILIRTNLKKRNKTEQRDKQTKVCFDQYKLEYLGWIKFIHVKMPYCKYIYYIYIHTKLRLNYDLSCYLFFLPSLPLWLSLIDFMDKLESLAYVKHSHHWNADVHKLVIQTSQFNSLEC